MIDASTPLLRRYVQAVTKMLLGDKTMRSGLAITAGSMTSLDGVAGVAELAAQSGMDLIHLDFTIDGAAATLRKIVVAAPRDHRCFVYSDCRLAQLPSARRAVILPPATCRGHFKVMPREIIHVASKPTDLITEGVSFAERRLAQLVRDGVDVTGQIAIHDVPKAA